MADVLVIGAGVAGMKASLLLASAGRHVHLVESSSVIGGRLIRCEDIFPAMECATCMVSPMQQDVLRNDLIDLITLGEILSIEGSTGNFKVRIRKHASCVDPVACIGCAECWNACPVEISNDFEENLSKRKAISVPCAGALPNVPWIDREHCLRWNGDETCTLCSDACVFAAVNYSEKDSDIEIIVSDIILATGYQPSSGDLSEKFQWGISPGIFTASEFERYYSSNGPTSGELLTKDGHKPSSAAIIVHPNGTDNSSRINTMYSLKFLHYLKEKLPDIRPFVFLDASYSPVTIEDRNHQKWQTAEADVILCTQLPEVQAVGDSKTLSISCTTPEGSFQTEAELLVLGTSMFPSEGTSKFIKLLTLECNDEGFIKRPQPALSSVTTSVPGVFTAGCAGGPMDIASSVTEAAAAVGRVLADANREGK
ncbi:MAG: FAD-binding protein [Candidatus Fermentibacteria bacterium]